jgi:hypothetical protein
MNDLHSLQLVRDQSTVPAPKLFGYISSSDRFGALLMLMEYLPGTLVVALKFDGILEQHKTSFFEEMTAMHIRGTLLD